MLFNPPEKQNCFPWKSCIVTESIYVDEVVGEMLEHLELEKPGVEVGVAEEN